MGAVDDIQPCGEKMKKAIRWMSDTLLTYPDKKRQDVLREAEIRFDLSPAECEFLNKNFSDSSTDNCS